MTTLFLSIDRADGNIPKTNMLYTFEVFWEKVIFKRRDPEVKSGKASSWLKLAGDVSTAMMNKDRVN